MFFFPSQSFLNTITSTISQPAAVSLLGDSVLQQHSRLLKSPTAKHYEVSLDIKTKSKVEMIISPSKYVWGAGFIFFLKKLCNKQGEPVILENAICNCIQVPAGFSKCFTHIIRPCHAHIIAGVRKGNWQQGRPDLLSPCTTPFKGSQPKDKYTFAWKLLQLFKASRPCLFYLHTSYRLACPSPVYCQNLLPVPDPSKPWLLRLKCSKAHSDDTPVAQV